MTMCRILFLVFLTDKLCVVDLGFPANYSILSKLSTERIVSATSLDITPKRHLHSSDLVQDLKTSLSIFAKRLWGGFRRYIQGETKLRRTFGAENIKRIMDLAMPKTTTTTTTITPIEFKPVLEDLTPNSTLSASDKKMGGKQLNQTHEKYNVYHYLRQKWKHQLVSENYDKTQPAIVNYVQSLSEIAVSLFQTINRKSNRWYLWKLKPGDTPSSDYTTQFMNLYKLTLAYGTNGTTYYRNKTVLTTVIESLDFMVTTKGYNGDYYHGYWWHWLIGVPDLFTKIMIVIYDELTQKQKDLYLRIINNYVSNSLFTKRLNNVNIGAYSGNVAETVLALGILAEEQDSVTLATDAIIQLFKPNGDAAKSFHPDGSFVHNLIPYTGLYGTELIKSVAQIMFITKDTEFEIVAIDFQILLDIIDRAFIPFIYDGEMIASVCGRTISRAQSSTKIGYGSPLLYDLLIMSKIEPKRTQELQGAIKFWMQGNLRYYLTNTRNYNDILIMTELLNNDSINGDALPFYGTRLYASMDRFVQRTPDYMFGLALYSSRISAFDAGENENKRGWHTADGMIYLYNDDEVQFGSTYWPTVDPYRLPGTTVDTVHLFDEAFNFMTLSEENWVGGVANDNQAVIGMALNKKGAKNRRMLLTMDLQAKKSWFIVEGQIVALGAGITGKTIASIETIIDNRLLNNKLNYSILSNEGKIHDPAEAATEKYFGRKKKPPLKVLWVLLHESSHKASIGYYFPTKEEVHIIGEQRIGTYSDINEQFMSPDIVTGNYSKLLINHGRKPVNASYAYVMLPGISKRELKEYIDTNPVAILANTRDVQAVKIREHNYIGINIWNEFGGEAAGISSNKPVSILKQTRKNEDTYTISDPTQSNTTIQIKIPEFTKVVRMSEGVEYDGEYNVFVINFENILGACEQFTVLYLIYEQIHL